MSATPKAPRPTTIHSGNEGLSVLKMSGLVSSYDQLVRQVEALRKENSHLRRELEDNSNHLSKLENETSDMKEVLKQLQSKLEQEACTLASSGRTDVLDQLKELHMDLTNYYELKYQPHNLRVPPESLAMQGSEGEDRLPLPPSNMGRARSPLRIAPHQTAPLSGEGTAVHPGPPHLLEGALAKAGSTGEGRVTAQHLDDLCKERTMLLKETEKEERERRWYYSQLQGLSQRLAELPRIDTFSMQMDLIRQQLEFEAQQLRSVMEERFGTSDEMVQRTQIRVARLEQLEKELQEAHEARAALEKSPPPDSQTNGCDKPTVPEPENTSNNSASEVAGDTGSKVEMVFWLLSMLATRDREEMSRTLLAMSSSQDSCIAMRKSGCVPLLVQILHDGGVGVGEASGAGGGGCSREARSRASAALHNIVYSQPDEGQARREMRVLHVLEQVRSHCETGWDWIETHLGTPSPGGTKTTAIPEPLEPQICQAMCAIMKLSFEEEYRRAMNELGGLQAVAELMQLDQELYGMQNDPLNMVLRRYAGMALTNLTFGDVVNKATLCSKKSCLQAIVAQLASDSEELHQVVSSILRNLSWRADINSKKTLREVGSVSALIHCALKATKESTLKSLLSALWNLSAHSTENKVAICSVNGALGFLVSTLTYKCQTNSLAIIESGGGILRNVSSLVATREDYRQVLRDHNCLQTLLQHLRSHSLTIVSNACGTLWNLSARSPKDQELLWDLGAVSMLRNLIHSKHKMIAMGSAAALRNLLTNRPPKYKDAAVISPGSCVPSLYMRKQKALEAELDAKNLAETFHSIEKQSPKHPNINKPLRHIESLAKDYASDSGCFDDDEAPNLSSSLDTGSMSVLSMFLNNSNFLQGQPHKKSSEPEQDMDPQKEDDKKSTPPDDEVSVAAEKLAKKITNTVAKIDKLVEDITMHTSSEDSFSLSSEDHFIDWQYGSDEPHEARAKSCSPCRLSDTSSFARRERLSRAHALLRLKTAYTSLSTDSLNSGSTSDGYCGSKDQVRPSARSATMQRRPNKLDLKVFQQGYLNNELNSVLSEESQKALPERDSEDSRNGVPEPSSTDTEKGQEPPPPTPATASTKVSSGDGMPTIKLSPSYQHIPLIQSVAKFGVAKNAINVQAAQAMRRQAWVPTVMTGGSIAKFSPMSAAQSPTVGQMETLQKYSVENTPICFSRCSSLSSLSSGDGALDGQSQSENELESDSSLEIIEVDDCDLVRREEQDETLADLSDSQLMVTDPKPFGSSGSPTSEPIEIPCSTKREKAFLRGISPGIHEDRTPSSSSENYTHETPLVMSRCSSVSSLGSFESPSIASSIQSDPCSEMISGTISPSDLPDSPGQTMPPSRSKTPCCADSSGQETQSVGGGSQLENNLRKFMEIADFKERFNLPPDLDTMIYFTVEKPTENFSCASSLSALPLHEHYIQKDVELKLMPLLHQKDNIPKFNVKLNTTCQDIKEYIIWFISKLYTFTTAPEEIDLPLPNKQLTFIKESPSVSRREIPSSRSVPTSQSASPRRARPSAPAVFLCSSRCQELKAAAQVQRQMQGQGQCHGQEKGLLRQTLNLSRASSSDRNISVRRPARRTSSESPCRIPQKTQVSGTLQRERDTFKRHASSPSINILNRVTSRSSVRSSSSDSSGRPKSEEDTKQRHQQPASLNGKATWRRIRDEDVPHILKSTLPSTALPLLPDGQKQKVPQLPGKLPDISLPPRKTSDATVQTEDFSAEKTNSSTSPTMETVPAISEEAAKVALQRKMTSGNNLYMQDGDSDGSFKSYSTASTSTSYSIDGHSGGVGHFRHSSPSKAVRVTPFNYIPSPMTCCLQDAQLRAPTFNEKSGEKLEA
ncbi:hypothetical protein AGOR_G00148350 [Albula goreensis]|uniref:Adenomatous polyposis coli protein 2 n=1 Tax=Albula goreensis TaxID=1534307 RepID=A0A8T3D8E3_9TELE|nr:hypothetical protein AGOR_G00148350 [Albula goreensis]